MKITLKVEKSIFGGQSLAYQDGKVIFIDGAIPGEMVEVDITSSQKDYSNGRVTRVVEKSPDRIDSSCPVFNTCGGCTYLHMDYKRELEEKKSIIEDDLMRNGKLTKEEIPEIDIISSERFHYRSHGAIKNNGTKTGFYKANSNEIVDFPENGCLLLAEPLIDKINTVKSRIKNDFKIAMDKENRPFYLESDDKRKITLKEEESDILYDRGINSFFQANRYLRSKMLNVVKTYAGNDMKEKIIDLGCGVGFFTLAMSDLAKKVVGLEISKNSIYYGRKNAKLNSKKNVFFDNRQFSDLHPDKDMAELVICDPPRAGLDRGARHSINKIRPEKIIYISCNPSTYSRDIKDFIKEGYKLNKLTFIDMFPGTKHIELISLLEL